MKSSASADASAAAGHPSRIAFRRARLSASTSVSFVRDTKIDFAIAGTVGGLILFARNYRDREQLAALCAEVHGLRNPPLPITIDHEGGRVQRCRDGFTALPPMRRLGALWDLRPDDALAAARHTGYVLAAELRACGVDFSFTPVLDLDYGRSRVIGDRAFHGDPDVVALLAAALIEGLREAGMGACGKHFPGHGWVEADSHVAIPVDERDVKEIARDMAPFARLVAAGALDAVMPAHVIYPQVDDRPAGFSPVWIDMLRRDVGFDGVIFSDDLSMEGAVSALAVIFCYALVALGGTVAGIGLVAVPAILLLGAVGGWAATTDIAGADRQPFVSPHTSC